MLPSGAQSRAKKVDIGLGWGERQRENDQDHQALNWALHRPHDCDFIIATLINLP